MSASSHCVFLVSLCCHFVSAPSCLSLALPLFLYLSVFRQYFSVARAQEIIEWCGRETPRALWPRLAAINPHVFFFLFWGGNSPTLTPSLPQYIWPANEPTDTLDSNTHQTQTQPLLTHLGGQERTHAAMRNRFWLHTCDWAVPCRHNVSVISDKDSVCADPRQISLNEHSGNTDHVLRTKTMWTLHPSITNSIMWGQDTFNVKPFQSLTVKELRLPPVLSTSSFM